MFQRILVPLDGSSRAERALPVAAQLARASHGSVLLMEVVSPPIDYGGALAQTALLTEQAIETGIEEATSYLQSVAQSATLAGIETKTEVLFGLVAQGILEVAQSRRADLIVMCSHGRTGFKRWVLGSVAQTIVHHSPVPVLVLREGGAVLSVSGSAPVRPLCILVPLDGSPLAETALAPAANLVAALAAPAERALHLTHVIKEYSLAAEEDVISKLNKEALEHAKVYLLALKERLQENFKDFKLSITWSIALDSAVADRIVCTAERGERIVRTEGYSGCDLIAMSTHGRGGLERLMMGSVTEGVLNATKLPILIVPPQRCSAGTGKRVHGETRQKEIEQ